LKAERAASDPVVVRMISGVSAAETWTVNVTASSWIVEFDVIVLLVLLDDKTQRLTPCT
jgi:hypothetical protein